MKIKQIKQIKQIKKNHSESLNTFQVHTLKNGVTILLEPMDTVESCSLGFWFKVGVKNETQKLSGAAHFIEHMLFKGTPKRTARNISESFDAIGGHFNAFSSKEYCCYYSRVCTRDLPFALDCMSDMILNSTFPESEFEKEREVILEELKSSKDSPEDHLHESFHSQIIANCRMSQPILGTEKTLVNFSQKDLVDFYHSNYFGSNLIISLSGKFNVQSVLKSIEGHFNTLKSSGKSAEKNEIKFGAGSQYLVRNGLKQVQVLFGLPALPADHPDRYAFNILCAALGGGMSSRLYHAIREKQGLAYSIYNYSLSFQKGGIWAVYAAVGSEKLAKYSQILFKELEKVIHKGFSKKEILKSQGQVTGGLILSQESTSSRMNRMALNWINHHKNLPVSESVQILEAITPEQVHQLASTLITPEKGLAATAIGPKSALKDWESLGIWKTPPKIILPEEES